MNTSSTYKGAPDSVTKLFSDSYDQIGYARCLDKTNMTREQVTVLLDDSLSCLERMLNYFNVPTVKPNITTRKNNSSGRIKS